jgi:hypothetical protein
VLLQNLFEIFSRFQSEYIFIIHYNRDIKYHDNHNSELNFEFLKIIVYKIYDYDLLRRYNGYYELCLSGFEFDIKLRSRSLQCLRVIVVMFGFGQCVLPHYARAYVSILYAKFLVRDLFKITFSRFSEKKN